MGCRLQDMGGREKKMEITREVGIIDYRVETIN